MNKEILKQIWLALGVALFVIILVKSFYEWTQGIQPDNFTVMVVLLIAISLESKFNKKN